MKLENAKKIVDHIHEAGEYVDLYEGYSGRGMYGRETTGVVCEDPKDVIFAMGELGIKDSRDYDNLGKNYIVY